MTSSVYIVQTVAIVQSVGSTNASTSLLTFKSSSNCEDCSSFIGHVFAASLTFLGHHRNFLNVRSAARLTVMVTRASWFTGQSCAHVILGNTSWCTFSLSSIISGCAVLTALAWVIWVGCIRVTASSVVVLTVRTFLTARVFTVGLTFMISIACVISWAFVMGVDTSWCAFSLVMTIAVAVLAAGIRVPGWDLTEGVITVAVSVLVAAGIFAIWLDALVILADGGGVLALGISQASRLTFASVGTIRFVAPLAGWTDSIPIVTFRVEPAAGDTGVGVRVTNWGVATTVVIHAAFGVADAICVRYLAGQRTGLAGAIDHSWPVTDWSCWIFDGPVKFKGMVRTSGRNLRPGGAWSALKQAKIYATKIGRFA